MFHRRIALAVLCLATALVASACGGGGGGGGTPFEPAPEPPAPSTAELGYAQDVLDLVNTERTSRGLDPVVASAGAAQAAYGHAYDMEVRGFFDHTNPSGEGPPSRLARAGVSFSGWGENIAEGQPTPAAVMDAWMGSSGHRQNILNPSFRRLGVGVRLTAGGPFWVQDFVAP